MRIDTENSQRFISHQEPLMSDAPAAPLDPAKDMVGSAHGNIDRVRAILAQNPAMANAAADWGNGDWETALGAAAHMGRRDISELLLAHGARLDLFAAAMLGHLDVVKAIVTAHPASPKAPGPHGIPLLAHAKAGGEPAAAVVAYLKTL